MYSGTYRYVFLLINHFFESDISYDAQNRLAAMIDDQHPNTKSSKARHVPPRGKYGARELHTVQ